LKSDYCEKNLLSGFGFENLEFVRVRSDMLRSIPKGVFKEFRKLMNLTLVRNKTDCYDEKHDSLKELYVLGNNMRLFPQKNIIELNNSSQNSNSTDEDLLDESVFQGIDIILLIKLEIQYFNLSSLTDNVFSQLANLQILNLIENEIISINSFTFTLKELNLSGNRISLLQPNSFHQLGSLELLDLSRNKIVQIEDVFFTGLDSLKRLRLSSNSLNEVLSNSFAELEKLQELDLSSNFIKTFDNKSIILNNALKILNISRNKLKEFSIMDANISKHLDELDVSFNELNTDHCEIICSDLTHLTVLKINNNKFDAIPFKIVRDYGGRYSIKEFDVSHNNLTDLGKYPFRHGQFEVINLSYNQLFEINPSTFAEQKNLDKLLLRNNNLTYLKSDFFYKIYSIKWLDLSWNNIFFIQINDSISEDVINLKWLSFSHNRIEHLLAYQFKLLVKLEELYLNWNQIELIDNMSFYGLKSLKVLDLSNNRLTELPVDGFNELASLIRLDLSWNELEVIHSQMLAGLGQLEQLQCGFNKIKTVEQNSFAGLNKLRMLDLSHNKLEKLNENDFDELEDLDIRGNNIRSEMPTSRSGKFKVHAD
jgi:Leucine-rich repeat (LRR) protein